MNRRSVLHDQCVCLLGPGQEWLCESVVTGRVALITLEEIPSGSQEAG